MMSHPTRSVPFLTSKDASKTLGVSLVNLYQAIRLGRVPEPPRDSAGRFLWFPEDIERARVALGADRRRREHRRQTEGVRHGD